MNTQSFNITLEKIVNNRIKDTVLYTYGYM